MKPSRSKLDLVHSCVVAGAGCIFEFRMVCPLLGTLCGNGIEGGPLSRDRCRKAESEVRQFLNRRLFCPCLVFVA